MPTAPTTRKAHFRRQITQAQQARPKLTTTNATHFLLRATVPKSSDCDSRLPRAFASGKPSSSKM